MEKVYLDTRTKIFNLFSYVLIFFSGLLNDKATLLGLLSFLSSFVAYQTQPAHNLMFQRDS